MPRRWRSAAATRGRRGSAAKRASAPSTAPISATRKATSSAPSAWGRPEPTDRGRNNSPRPASGTGTELPLKIRVIMNRGGGSFADDMAERLAPLFEGHGIDARILADTMALEQGRE